MISRAIIGIGKNDKGKREVVCSCPLCHDITVVKVDAVGLESWIGGYMLIQEALPEESRSTRETLISGFCPKCQMKIFSGGMYGTFDSNSTE